MHPAIGTRKKILHPSTELRPRLDRLPAGRAVDVDRQHASLVAPLASADMRGATEQDLLVVGQSAMGDDVGALEPVVGGEDHLEGVFAGVALFGRVRVLGRVGLAGRVGLGRIGLAARIALARRIGIAGRVAGLPDVVVAGGLWNTGEEQGE
jgi:hypothetical protein